MTSSVTCMADKPEWFNSKHRIQSHRVRPKTNTMPPSNNILVVNAPIFGRDEPAYDTAIFRSSHKSAKVDMAKSTWHKRKTRVKSALLK